MVCCWITSSAELSEVPIKSSKSESETVASPQSSSFPPEDDLKFSDLNFVAGAPILLCSGRWMANIYYVDSSVMYEVLKLLPLFPLVASWNKDLLEYMQPDIN